MIFSGGEPTLQPALRDAIADVRKLGFRVGLHTAGIVPERLQELLPSLDWVGFDLKAPFAVYSKITGVVGSGERALESLRRLLASEVRYEVRTTVHSALLSFDDLLTLRKELLAVGVKHFVLQHYRSPASTDSRLPASSARWILPDDYACEFLDFSVR